MNEPLRRDPAVDRNPMIREYFARVSESRTINQLNATHINLCNVMTPFEVLMLNRPLAAGRWTFPPRLVGPDAARGFTVALRDHFERMAGDLAYAEKPVPEPFERERLAGGMWRFSGGGERAGKTLLIAFTGNADRLMMPTPTYLQHFDAAKVDIVFVVDRSKNHYQRGVPEIGASFAELADALPAILATDAYRSLSLTGTSSGALPAVLTGLRLKAGHVLAFGIDNPADPRWKEVDAPTLLVNWRAASPDTRVTVAFGAQHAGDRASTEEAARLTGAEMVAVSHPTDPVNHNAAYPLVTQGLFTAFAARNLGLQ